MIDRPTSAMTDRYRFKLAETPEEIEAIQQLCYRTFVVEIKQHPDPGSGRRTAAGGTAGRIEPAGQSRWRRFRACIPRLACLAWAQLPIVGARPGLCWRRRLRGVPS